ncbi:MAG: hypothetical protein KTR31_33145 [Myxococcales bacterium]|nr:hypothetical protein [Myxococcales bacterium]
MKRDSAAFDADAFFRVASWVCVRTSNATAVARSLELLHYQPAKVPDDLADIDPHELPCLIAAVDGWTFVFGHALGLKSARALSTEFGECHALHIDADSETYRCERATDGKVLRRVYASKRDAEYDSEGDPGAGEPHVPWVDGGTRGLSVLELTGDDVTNFAKAWGADPLVMFKRRVPRAFVASRKPLVTVDKGDARPSVVGTVLSLLVVLLVVGGLGFGVWWAAQSDQEEAATSICERQFLCSGCVGCAASPPHPCAEAFDACEESEACFALTSCLADCLDLGARTGLTPPSTKAEPCFAECRATHAEGLAAYCEWTECSYEQACSELCTDPGYTMLSACE